MCGFRSLGLRPGLCGLCRVWDSGPLLGLEDLRAFSWVCGLGPGLRAVFSTIPIYNPRKPNQRKSDGEL